MFSRNFSVKLYVVLLLVLCSSAAVSCRARSTAPGAEPPVISSYAQQIHSPTLPLSPSPTDPQASSQTPAVQTPEPVFPEGTPNVIGIYIEKDGDRVLVRDSHKIQWTAGQDIECYESIASSAELLTGSGFSSIWNAAWSVFSASDDVKIGYTVDIFLKSGEKITRDIKSPADTKLDTEYVEFYIYDDVHQTPGEWYSHIEEGDVNEKTIATSIKLTAGSNIDSVDKMHLKAYIYLAGSPESTAAEYEIDILRA